MRRVITYVLAVLAGFFLTREWAKQMDRRQKRKVPAYRPDVSTQYVWGLLGGFGAFMLVALRPIWLPVLGMVKRHPKLTGLLGLTTLFGANWVFWDAAEKAEKIMQGRSCYPASTDGYRPRDWKLAGSLPAAADDMLGIGPSQFSPSDAAFFDALGAEAEQRMVATYRSTGRLPGDFSS